MYSKQKWIDLERDCRSAAGRDISIDKRIVTALYGNDVDMLAMAQRGSFSPTSNLNDAMQVVPSGFVVNIGNDLDPWAAVWKDDPSYDGEPEGSATANTMAIALTAAALMARSTMVEG